MRGGEEDDELVTLSACQKYDGDDNCAKVKANGEVDVHRGLVINSKQAAVERVKT